MPLSVLAGRRVVLGVCGGIAAYKAVEVCRRLTDAGALVSPVLTEAATRFVGPLTFSALAAEPAALSLFEGGAGLSEGGGGHPVPHIRLAQMADAVVVAPATARAIGSYAAGIASDLLTSVLIATRAPVLVCPAMHTEMWEHPAVQDNVRLLRRRGVHVLEPDDGRLAGGDSGAGRLPEPEAVVLALAQVLTAPARPATASAAGASAATASAASASATTAFPAARAADGGAGATGPLRGARAVVSAGGTREPLDAVRYLGNRSSGKQGYAMAAALAARGAEVTLVTASDLPVPPGVVAVPVATAAEMAEAVLDAAAGASVVVMVAAVADYRPESPVDGKMKKTGQAISVRLVPTRDILAELGARRTPGQVLVGFAAETAGGPDLVRYARRKLDAKRVDLVVANDVSVPGAGFGSERNAAVIVSGGSVTDLGLADKTAVAAKVADAIEQLLAAPPPRASEPGEQA